LTVVAQRVKLGACKFKPSFWTGHRTPGNQTPFKEAVLPTPERSACRIAT